MSIAAKLTSWLSFSSNRQDRLRGEARRLAVGILPLNEVLSRREEVPSHVGRIDGNERWESWRWLVAAHHMAQSQLSVVRDCRSVVRRASRLRLDEKDRDHFDGSFIACFSGPLEASREEISDLGVLDTKLEEREGLWRHLENEVEEAQPPVFVSHAFLRLSDSTGLEMASLFIAGLIGLGAVFMAFFYATAAGQAANAYWTLDDLIVQGIFVLPQIGAALLVLEVVFAVMRRVSGGRGSYRWHSVIMRHPIIVAVGFFLVMSVVLSIDGHRRGKEKLEDFKTAMNKESGANRQMATVLDRTVLNDIYLVGTTDRTAIFLQMKEGSTKVSGDAPTFGWTAGCVASSFGIFSGSCGVEDESKHLVLVMDRALVVCHAKKGECETPKPEAKGNGNGNGNDESDPIAQQLASLDTKVGEIKQLSGDHHTFVEGEFEDVEEHMNRHLGIVVKAIGGANGVEIDPHGDVVEDVPTAQDE